METLYGLCWKALESINEYFFPIIPLDNPITSTTMPVISEIPKH